MKRKDTELLTYLCNKRKGGIAKAYHELSKPRKQYVRELVRRFGWKVDIAIQHAYVFPYDPWIYDYRNGTGYKYEVNKRTGCVGKRVM